MNRPVRSLFVLALLAALSCIAADKPYGRATVAPFKQAPVIDGKIAPGEWDGAVETTGFQYIFNAHAGYIEPRMGHAWVGFTADKVYLAIVSEYPPDGKDHSSGTNRDKDYVGDESIEIWLDPNRTNRDSQKGDLRFYQMNANAQGGIYDIAFDPKSGPNTGWNGNWEFVNTVDHEKHIWTAELSLPFADLGWKPGEAVGKTLGILVSRNYKGPWQQVTSFPVMGAFIDWYRYAAIELTKDSPSVQITSLGNEFHKGELEFRATVFNPGPARQVKAAIHVTSSDMPGLDKEEVLDLPAGGTANFSLDAKNQRLHEDAQHAFTFDVTSPDGAAVYLDYEAKWTKGPEKKWLYRIGPDPDAAVRTAYYPSYKFVRLRVDTRELSKEAAEKIKLGTVSISGPKGEVYTKKLTFDAMPFQEELQVGDVADGKYTLTVKLDGWPDEFTRSFERIHFPWEGNKRGITDQVIAPFTPVKVAGDTVSVIYRDYALDGLGLPSSIKAAGNVNAGGPLELLAKPVTLLANGKAVKGKGSFTSRQPTVAVHEGKAATPAVSIASKVTTEIDGCQKLELTLTPGTAKAELQSLVLDIPLKDALMPLWHVSTTSLRINPAGDTPAGNGVIWKSSDFPDGNWFGNFKCYLWLGAEERGLAVFGDNDAGWVLSTDKKGQPNADCQQLIRRNGVLTIRLNLVQAPIVIDQPRTITIGLMASPAKPMRSDWRATGLSVNSAFNMGYANPATFCAKYPWGNDWRLADWCYARRTGKPGPTKEVIEDWKKRNFPDDMDPKFRDGAIRLALGNFVNNFNPNLKYMKMYFEEFHTTAQEHPESHVFQSEWSGRWNSKLIDHDTREGHKMFGIATGGIVASYRDFAVYYSAEWAKRGVGSYFDNSFPLRWYDTLTSSAYVLPNGQTQPSAGIWARREYLHRVWNVHRTMAPPDALPTMMIHMTNTHILPYMCWNDENLDLEWKFGPEVQQTKFHHAFLRAETLGRQTGNVPWALDKIVDAKSKEERARAIDSRFGTMMVHEIRWWDVQKQDRDRYKLMTDFGYGTDACQVYNYWNPGYPLTASDPEAKTLLLVNGDAAFVIVCTWNPNPATVTFKLDTKALGFEPTAVDNAEQEGDSVAVKKGSFSLPLDGYAVRLLRVR